MSSNKIDREKPIVVQETIEHAHNLYIKCIKYTADLDKQTKSALGETAYKILRRYLPGLNLSSIFKNNCFLDVIEDSVYNGQFEMGKSANAFTELEKYFKLLYKHPWKNEFRVLKLYSGYFNAKIKSHLSSPEQIFILVGYRRHGEDQLILKDKPNRDLILNVCFECLVAAVTCATIGDRYKELKDCGGDMKDALKWRKTGIKPDDNYLAEKLRSKKLDVLKNSRLEEIYDLDKNTVTSKSKTNPIDSEYLVVDMASSGHPTRHTKDILASDIPFIDDGQFDNGDDINLQGTHDDHIVASLREVNLKEKKLKQVSRENGFEINTKYPQVTGRASSKPSLYTKHGDNGRQSNSTSDYIASLPRKESYEVHYPPVSAKTLPNISEYKKRTHTSHNTRPVDVTDSKRHQSRTRDSAGTMMPHNVILDVDGASSYMSDYFNAPMENSYLYLESMPINSLPIQNFLKPSEKWTCSYCTVTNEGNTTICKSCCKSHNQGPDLDNPKAGDRKKVCATCTLENEPNALVCSACDEPLKPSNVQTYV